MSVRSRRARLDQRLSEVEEAVKIFSRDKVYVKVDSWETSCVFMYLLVALSFAEFTAAPLYTVNTCVTKYDAC